MNAELGESQRLPLLYLCFSWFCIPFLQFVRFWWAKASKRLENKAFRYHSRFVETGTHGAFDFFTFIDMDLLSNQEVEMVVHNKWGWNILHPLLQMTVYALEGCCYCISGKKIFIFLFKKGTDLLAYVFLLFCTNLQNAANFFI